MRYHPLSGNLLTRTKSIFYNIFCRYVGKPERDEKTILITITNPAFAVRQIHWANTIELTNWKPVVHCLCSIATILEIIESKSLKKPELLTGSVVEKSIFYRFSNRLTSIINRIPYTGFLRALCLIVDDIILTKERISEIRRLIKWHNVSMLLMPDASPAYFAPLLASAARKENVVVLTNPLDRDSPKSYAMIYKSDNSLLVSGFTGKIISKIFSKWIIEYENKRILRLSVQQIIAQEILQISPPQPWYTIGYLEDIVVVNNKRQQLFLKSMGIVEEKLKVTGCPELDYIADIAEDGLNDFERNTSDDFLSKPIILCALPQTHWIAGRPEAEFQNHKEMIDTWIKCLTAQSNYNIIISLHPSMPYHDYQYLDCENLKVAQEDILKLIPICSIFIACLSSTIQFAIALGKPVINYDVYRYSLEIEYLSFSESKGTVTVLNKNDFSKVVTRITSDRDYYNFLAGCQKNISKEWGLLDGQSVHRFANLIDNIYLKTKG